MTGRGTRGLPGMALALVAAASCLAAALPTDPIAPAPRVDATTVVMVSDRTLSGSDRVARRFEHLAHATGLWPGLRVELAGGPRGMVAPLEAAAARDDVAGVVVIAGDRTFLPGLPQRPVRPDRVLNDRRVDMERVEALLAAVDSVEGERGVPVLLVTAPVGALGRIELPELARVAEHLSARPGTLDARAAFAELERSALFQEARDVLNTWGHDVLAELLLEAAVEERWLALPPEARPAWRAWLALRAAVTDAGQVPAGDLARRARHALQLAPRDPADALRAALVLDRLREEDASALPERPGILETVPALEPWPAEVPGAAVVAWLARRTDVPGPTSALEARLLEILALKDAPPEDLWARAEALVADHPGRSEAWIVRGEVARRLGREAQSAVVRRAPLTLGRDLALAYEPRDLQALPALLVAQTPLEGALPDGRLPARIRRLVQLDMERAARERLASLHAEGQVGDDVLAAFASDPYFGERLAPR